MNKILTKIKREDGFVYRVDKEGNVLKEKYNILKDPYTLVTLTILILGCLYYLQVSQMKTVESNFEESCIYYMEARDIWIQDNPGEIPTLEQVFSIEIKR